MSQILKFIVEAKTQDFRSMIDKKNGERWVWYALNGEAHLFSQKTGQDALSILPSANNGLPQLSVLQLNCLQGVTEGIQGI